MRRRLVSKLEQADATAPEAGDLKSLESRLDAAVAFLRIDYLEGRHNSLGQTEAKAVLVRMLAPAASIGWQASKSSSQILGWLHDVLPRLF